MTIRDYIREVQESDRNRERWARAVDAQAQHVQKAQRALDDAKQSGDAARIKVAQGDYDREKKALDDGQDQLGRENKRNARLYPAGRVLRKVKGSTNPAPVRRAVKPVLAGESPIVGGGTADRTWLETDAGAIAEGDFDDWEFDDRDWYKAP